MVVDRKIWWARWRLHPRSAMMALMSGSDGLPPRLPFSRAAAALALVDTLPAFLAMAVRSIVGIFIAAYRKQPSGSTVPNHILYFLKLYKCCKRNQMMSRSSSRSFGSQGETWMAWLILDNSAASNSIIDWTFSRVIPRTFSFLSCTMCFSYVVNISLGDGFVNGRVTNLANCFYGEPIP